MGDYVGHLTLLVGGVDRNHNSPKAHKGKPGQDKLATVGEQNSDMITLLDPQRDKVGG